MDTTLHVPDMSCDGCVRRITRVLDGAGASHAEVLLRDRTVRLRDVDAAGLARVREALERAGYPAAPDAP